MEITTKILKERFIEYNKRYFDDKLPMVDFRRHRTGNPVARLNTPNNGNLSISFSTVYNWNDKLIRDTLIYKIPCSGVISRPAASTSCRSFFITSAGIHLRSTLTVRTRLRLRTMSIGA